MGVGVSYARVLSARTVNGRVLYDIAVQTDAGEIRPGEIDGTGAVFADSLIVGMVTGTAEGGSQFRPMRVGGGSSAVRGIITGRTALGADRFEYRWKAATGPENPADWVEGDGAELIAYQPLEGAAGGGFRSSGVSDANLAQQPGFAPVGLPVGARALFVQADGAWYIQTAQAIDGTCGGA